MWTNPFVQLFLSYAVAIVSVAFLPPTPMIRLSAFYGVLAYTVLGVCYTDRSQATPVWLEFCAECTFGIVLYSHHFIFLAKAAPPPGSSTTRRLTWAVSLAANPRGIGTTWQIRNLPSFSRKDPSYVPLRRSFIIQRIATCLFFYVMMKSFRVVDEEIFIASLRDGDYSEYKESVIRRIGDVSMRELFIRAWLPFHSFINVWCQHQCLHCLLSVSAVVLGDEPHRWPPLYGYIREAYSLRRFWGYVFDFPSRTTRRFSNAGFCFILLTGLVFLAHSGIRSSASPL
jgi:hypothetical protein